MTAANDPLARVQAMVASWTEAELFDTFDTTASEVSPLNALENCGFGHFRHFRHPESDHVGTRHLSPHTHLQERQEEQGVNRR